jgi:hypothetical protein
MLIDDIRSVIDAMDETARTLAEYARPAVRLLDVCDAYDALAPDWTSAPEWAQWYALDADGEAGWYDDEPPLVDGLAFWDCPDTYRTLVVGSVAIPIGIDWRLCLWQRPEATR